MFGGFGGGGFGGGGRSGPVQGEDIHSQLSSPSPPKILLAFFDHF